MSPSDLRLVHDPDGGQYVACMVDNSDKYARVRRFDSAHNAFESGVRCVIPSWILGPPRDDDPRAVAARKLLGEK